MITNNLNDSVQSMKTNQPNDSMRKPVDRHEGSQRSGRSSIAMPRNVGGNRAVGLRAVAERVVCLHTDQDQDERVIRRTLFRFQDEEHLRYWGEACVRTNRQCRDEIEFEQIFRDKKYDWYFHAFTNHAKDRFLFWAILRLSVVVQENEAGRLLWSKLKDNGDGTEFQTFKIWPRTPPNMLVAWDGSQAAMHNHVQLSMGGRIDETWLQKKSRLNWRMLYGDDGDYDPALTWD